jgi:hypothetical protein
MKEPLNSFSFSLFSDRPDIWEIRMKLNPAFEKHFMPHLKDLAEIELLQGVRKKLNDGRILTKIELCDEKCHLLKQGVYSMAFPENLN